MKHLLCAIMFQDNCLLKASLSLLKNEFGPVKAKSPVYDFNFTDYYEEEFGKNLKKTIVIFNKSIQKHDLVEIRDVTGEIERIMGDIMGDGGKRAVNIDPGYISRAELVLASKKYLPFKEDLGNGIFAHKVMEFKEGKTVSFSHTFADYLLNSAFFESIVLSLPLQYP